jgi:hypothetical protein
MDQPEQRMHTNRAEAVELIQWWKTWEKYQTQEKREHDTTKEPNNTGHKTIKRTRGE